MSGRVVGEYAVYVGSSCYLPGDTVPAGVAKEMGDHCFVDGAEPDSGVPPQAGKGSGKDAWAEYATANGVQIDPEATRDDIIAACTAAGVATE